MRVVLRILCVLSFILICAQAQSQSQRGSQPLDASSEQALGQTQTLLRNQSEREKALAADPKAREHDQKISGVLGDQKEKAYELSAQLTETITRESGGDPKKMQELMNSLMANPQLLEKYLSPAQRDDIRKMASEIESKQGSPPSSPNR